jgi:hypothetical protein
MGNVSDNETFNAAAAGCACGAVLGMQSGTAMGAVTGCALLGSSMAIVEGSKYVSPRQEKWSPTAATPAMAQQYFQNTEPENWAKHAQKMREQAATRR